MSTSTIQKNRLAASNRQFGRCYYCNAEMLLDDQRSCSKRPVWSRCTAEHLIPRSEGGGNTRENIVAACFLCNKRRPLFKAASSPEEYREHVMRRMSRGKWRPR